MERFGYYKDYTDSLLYDELKDLLEDIDFITEQLDKKEGDKTEYMNDLQYDKERVNYITNLLKERGVLKEVDKTSKTL